MKIVNIEFSCVGDFKNGCEIKSPCEVVYHNRNYYKWYGDFPKIIPADSSPIVTGGIGENGWVPITTNNEIRNVWLPQVILIGICLLVLFLW